MSLSWHRNRRGLGCCYLLLLYLVAWENSQFYWFDNYRELCAYLIAVSHSLSVYLSLRCICIKLKCKYRKCRRTRQIFALHPKTDWQPERHRMSAIGIVIEIETATGIEIKLWHIQVLPVPHICCCCCCYSHCWPHLHAADPCPLRGRGCAGAD